jgi:NTE family protein
MEQVYRTDIRSLSSLVLTLLKDLSLGGLLGGGQAQSLLDFSPLKDLLNKSIRFDQIQESVKSGHLYAVAIAATNYYSGKSFIFIQGKEGHPLWEKSRRIALSTQLTADHVQASCAIPIIFQPVQVSTHLGEFYFGDGGLRLVAPLSPAIRLGAERVFAIGIRSQKASEERSKKELLSTNELSITMKKPPLAQIVGVTLNSFFLDHLDTDIEHLMRVNDIAQKTGAAASTNLKEPIRTIQHLVVQPSVDLAEIANKHSSKMPAVISYMMEGLGTSRADTGDLMSYLLFDSSYTQDLIQLGYQDASKRIDEIETFILNV